jgi:hypothetical protein
MTYDNPSVEEPADEDEIDHDLLRKQRIEDELAWGNL